MSRAVAAAGLRDRVSFAEVSVDPWRDTPGRLRAFKGKRNLETPQAPWTVRQGLDDIGRLVGKRIPGPSETR